MSSRLAVAEDVARRRRTILHCSLTTFAREGFRGTDVQVIADAAGVGKGTVYRNFESKENLFWETTFFVLGQLADCLAKGVAEFSSPRAQLQAMGRAYADFFESNEDCLEVFVQGRAMFRGDSPEKIQAYHEELIAEYAKIVERGTAQGEFHVLDPRDTIISLGSVLYGSVVFNCYSGDELSLSQRADRVMDIFLAGISMPSEPESEGSRL